MPTMVETAPLPTNEIFQGGMGVAVSNYRLAGEVARNGEMGIVSGVEIGRVLVCRLQDGDPTGEMREALAAFPNKEIAQRIFDLYFIDGGKAEDKSYERCPPMTAKPTDIAKDLAVLGGFVEVWLAKRSAGDNGSVGINMLTKIEPPTIYTLYGAMLAGVDTVVMGAGIPSQVPEVLDRLARGEITEYGLKVLKANGQQFALSIDPRRYTNGEAKYLRRPRFGQILTTHQSAMGNADFYVVEGPDAGGHNAPPRKVEYDAERRPIRDEWGQPIYTELDQPDFDELSKRGKPFWIAGGEGNRDGILRARRLRHLGAMGIQAGSVFALCEESGLREDIKSAVLGAVFARDENGLYLPAPNSIASPLISPAGFPFRVVVLDGTLGGPQEDRPYECSIKALGELVYDSDKQKVTHRCPATGEVRWLRDNPTALGSQRERWLGAVCMCAALMAAAGYPQVRKSGSKDMAVVTLGAHYARDAREVGQPLTAQRIIESYRAAA